MSTLRITRGLPGSGKTTWAKEWASDGPNRYRVNRDDLRTMLFGIDGKARLTYQEELAVTAASRAAVLALLAYGDVIVDDMNIRPKYVREWGRFAKAHGHQVILDEFHISVDECVARDAARTPSLGEDVIRSIAAKYTCGGTLLPVPPDQPEESPAWYEPPANGVQAVMVDIDGTLALMGDRSPYDLTRVGEDTPNWPVIEAVQAAAADGLHVIYCSGREDTCRDTTQQWLNDHVAIPGPLLMRKAGDRRKDAVVKAELFNEHVRADHDVRYVLDDRQQVVDMWRSLGLTVFQVARGDF